MLEGGYDRRASAVAIEVELRASATGRAPDVAGEHHSATVAVERAVEAQRRYGRSASLLPWLSAPSLKASSRVAPRTVSVPLAGLHLAREDAI